MNESISIVVIGYNKPESTKRLLDSLNRVNFNGDRVNLIISIDFSGNDDVYIVSQNFNWLYGEKIIIRQTQKLGLKRHVFLCGDLTEKYENLIVLEDDLFVSPNMYNFTRDALSFYKGKSEIVGIGLYNNKWDQNSNRPFEAIYDSYDVYFMKYACSWGQVWTKENWSNFKSWYENVNDENFESISIPPNVRKWNNSWLKYHIKYCIEQNKYFVYPRVALTSNFGVAGEHNVVNNNGFQVPILLDSNKHYNFCNLNESLAIYDAYFECESLANFLTVNSSEICVDLYGTKNNAENKKYWLTTHEKEFSIVESFDLSMRPHEMNVICGISGRRIKLYNTMESTKRKTTHSEELYLIEFDVRNTSYKKLFKYSLLKAKAALKRKFTFK